jgi:hypothetical protein
MKIAFCDIAPCSLVELTQRFTGAYNLYNKGAQFEPLKRRSISTRPHGAIYIYISEGSHLPPNLKSHSTEPRLLRGDCAFQLADNRKCITNITVQYNIHMSHAILNPLLNKLSVHLVGRQCVSSDHINDAVKLKFSFVYSFCFVSETLNVSLKAWGARCVTLSTQSSRSAFCSHKNEVMKTKSW